MESQKINEVVIAGGATILTVEFLLKLTDMNNIGIENTIKNLNNLKKEYEIIQAKPKLRAGCTAEQFKNFPTKLKEYEDSCKAKKETNKLILEFNNSVDDLIEAFIIEVTSFDTIVPEKYKEGVLNAAKLRAKNDGFVYMFAYLDEIVGIFNV